MSVLRRVRSGTGGSMVYRCPGIPLRLKTVEQVKENGRIVAREEDGHWEGRTSDGISFALPAKAIEIYVNLLIME